MPGQAHSGDSWGDVLSFPLKTKPTLSKELLSNQICVGTCVLENMCFVLKLDFPGKNNGSIKGDKCLVGQKRTHSFAQNVLKLGEKPLTAPGSLAWVRGQGSQLVASCVVAT